MPRTLEELTSTDPAWPLVEELLAEAQRPALVLPIDPEAGEAALVAMQVTDRSPMGAVVRHTAGLRVDDGWIRILGAGRPGLVEWNAAVIGGHGTLEPGLGGALVIGADAIGGFFVLDGGAFGSPGQVHHLGADTLQIQPMQGGYSGWLEWCLLGDLDDYYGQLRWPGWRGEVSRLGWSQGMHLYPPPWSVEGRDPATVSRAPVPLAELWGVTWSTRAQLAITP
jgi:hypothetical protein